MSLGGGAADPGQQVLVLLGLPGSPCVHLPSSREIEIRLLERCVGRSAARLVLRFCSCSSAPPSPSSLCASFGSCTYRPPPHLEPLSSTPAGSRCALLAFWKTRRHQARAPASGPRASPPAFRTLGCLVDTAAAGRARSLTRAVKKMGHQAPSRSGSTMLTLQAHRVHNR